jgi:hypothetical protein
MCGLHRDPNAPLPSLPPGFIGKGFYIYLGALLLMLAILIPLAILYPPDLTEFKAAQTVTLAHP